MFSLNIKHIAGQQYYKLKNMKHLMIFCLLLAGTSSFAQAPNTADDKKAKEATKQVSIQKMIASRLYSFSAESALPINDGSIPLTYGYYLRVQRDTLIAYLPYFGDAYEIPMDLTADNGIDFTSTKFTYNAVQNIHGYEITIVPQDVKDVKKMYLDISPDGYASLRISNLSRSGINFNGSIEQLSAIKKKSKHHKK